MNKPAALFLACFVAATSAFAKDTSPAPRYEPARFTQSDRADRIRALAPEVEQIYREFAISNHIPGLSFGIVLEGGLLFSGSYGLARIEGKVPATDRTLFRIASMSKSFTAMAILHLRERGKLRLDDPAARYLPELKRVELLTRDAPQISIRDLLTHSAGFPEDNPWGDQQLADSDEDLTKLLKAGLTFSNPPGVAYEYSNLGFALLGRIVKRVSGTSCQEYITRFVLSPLGMRHTEWEYTRVEPELLAHGYRWEEERWKEEPLLHDGVFGPMGGMISSVEEFARYVALHLSAWPPRDAAEVGPVKRSSIREMHQPWRFSALNDAKKEESGCASASAYCYGLGWLRDCEGRTFIGHSGGLPGFGSNWRILPEYGMGVVLLANRTYSPCTAVNTRVLKLIVERAGLHPRELPVSAILRERKTELMRFLPDWENAVESGIFAENFFRDLRTELRREKARALFEKIGRIESVSELVPENNLRGSFVVHGTSDDLKISFTLSPENPPLIQELTFEEKKR